MSHSHNQTQCQTTGCSSHLCAAESITTTCQWEAWYECVQQSTCGDHGNKDTCGWALTDDFLSCLDEHGKSVGCMNSLASNYDETAVYDDSCLFSDGVCSNSCSEDTYCRAACDDNLTDIGYECVPYVEAGEDCGDYTLACFQEQCLPGLSCVDKDPMIADESGLCCASEQGDINNDNETNILDIIVAINVSLDDSAPSPFELCAADLNNDGLINVLDIILLANEILDDTNIF